MLSRSAWSCRFLANCPKLLCRKNRTESRAALARCPAHRSSGSGPACRRGRRRGVPEKGISVRRQGRFPRRRAPRNRRRKTSAWRLSRRERRFRPSRRWWCRRCAGSSSVSQQQIEGRGVGESRVLADRGVGTLLMAIGAESGRVEGDQRRTGGLCAITPLMAGWMRAMPASLPVMRQRAVSASASEVSKADCQASRMASSVVASQWEPSGDS